MPGKPQNDDQQIIDVNFRVETWDTGTPVAVVEIDFCKLMSSTSQCRKMQIGLTIPPVYQSMHASFHVRVYEPWNRDLEIIRRTPVCQSL